jgi:hypothetical protein
VRQQLIEHLENLIAGSDACTARRRDEFAGSLKAKPGLRRLLRRTKAGLLRIDRVAAKLEAHYDGKWLLRTLDLTLTAEDLAAATKQLLAVERGWRDAACTWSPSPPPAAASRSAPPLPATRRPSSPRSTYLNPPKYLDFTPGTGAAVTD